MHAFFKKEPHAEGYTAPENGGNTLGETTRPLYGGWSSCLVVASEPLGNQIRAAIEAASTTTRVIVAPNGRSALRACKESATDEGALCVFIGDPSGKESAQQIAELLRTDCATNREIRFVVVDRTGSFTSSYRGFHSIIPADDESLMLAARYWTQVHLAARVRSWS